MDIGYPRDAPRRPNEPPPNFYRHPIPNTHIMLAVFVILALMLTSTVMGQPRARARPRARNILSDRFIVNALFQAIQAQEQLDDDDPDLAPSPLLDHLARSLSERLLLSHDRNRTGSTIFTESSHDDNDDEEEVVVYHVDDREGAGPERARQYLSDNRNVLCGICLDEVKPEATSCPHAASHCFCIACVAPALATTRSRKHLCPVCRQPWQHAT